MRPMGIGSNDFIRYKGVLGRVIEIPAKYRNKAIAAACIATVETGAGMAMTLGGIASKEPVYSGIGLCLLGKAAGFIAMLKGSIWNFAKKSI